MENRLQNQNSLDNLKKENKKHPEYGKGYALPQEKVDELFMLLAGNENLTNAAKKLGITYDTAKKYFEKGDERRGIQSLQKRLVMYQTKRSEKFDKEFLKRRKDLIVIVQEQITKLRTELVESADTKKISYTALEKMIKLEISLMGAPQKIEETGLLTAEDIKTLENVANEQ